MKEFIEKMKNIAGGENKQKLVLFGSIAVVMTIIIVAIAITVKIVGIKITYEELEDKLATTANSYLRDHKEEAPTPTNPTVVISAETLVENKYMKPLKKYVKDASCTANVNVLYNSGTFKYLPFLTCNDFKTEKFAETLKKKILFLLLEKVYMK